VEGNVHVKALVPVRVQSLFHDAGGVCLLGVNCDDGERIRQTEDVPFGEAICGYDWKWER